MKCRSLAALLAGLWLGPAALVGGAQESGPGEPAHPPGIDLPAGEGRELVLRACTRCHDLKGLPLYRAYWDRARWRAMVDTMVKNGARLGAAEQEVVADYLARHFGTASGS